MLLFFSLSFFFCSYRTSDFYYKSIYFKSQITDVILFTPPCRALATSCSFCLSTHGSSLREIRIHIKKHITSACIIFCAVSINFAHYYRIVRQIYLRSIASTNLRYQQHEFHQYHTQDTLF